MTKIKCPLCHSSNIYFKESISASEIEYQYERSFKINTNLHTNEITYCVCNACRLGFFYPMAVGDEILYEKLQHFEWYYMSDKPEYIIAKKHLTNLGSVLEVGAGKAAFSQVIGKNRYVGLEFNDEAIKRAQGEGVTLLKESVEEHAANHKEKYNAVVSFQVLEHVSSPSSFIQGCVDSLQHDGQLIVAVPNHDGVCGLTQNHLLDMPPHHVTHWSVETLTKLAMMYGLKLSAIELEPLTEYHKLGLRKSVWENRLRTFFRFKSSLLDYSFPSRVISKLATILANWVPVTIANINGHTVVAIYRKI